MQLLLSGDAAKVSNCENVILVLGSVTLPTEYDTDGLAKGFHVNLSPAEHTDRGQ